jgi:hypothetical protein
VNLRVSIVVPVRKADSTIQATLADLLGQDCSQPFEVVGGGLAGWPTADTLGRLKDTRLRVMIASAPCAAHPGSAVTAPQLQDAIRSHHRGS